MKTAKYFDIHDEDVTPEIYTLLFCDAFVELQGNDMWYKITPFGYYCLERDEVYDEDGGWQDYKESKYQKSSNEQYQNRLKRGWHNCYHDTEAMKNLCENPITCEEALKRFKQWLIDKGVTPKDTLFVKIWW